MDSPTSSQQDEHDMEDLFFFEAHYAGPAPQETASDEFNSTQRAVEREQATHGGTAFGSLMQIRPPRTTAAEPPAQIKSDHRPARRISRSSPLNVIEEELQ